MMNKPLIRVLFIEDVHPDAQLMQERLTAAQSVGWNLPHFEIEHVDRLQKALTRLEETTFDVVLTDLDLPDSRAEQTVAALRARIPRMPLVVLTGREDETLAQETVRAGVQDYLYKNEATGSLLARTLTYAIERQQVHARLEQRVEARTAELQRTLAGLQREVQKRERAEKARRESERQYRELFEKSRDGFVMVDMQGRFLDANPAYCQMVGYTLEELKEKADFYEITPARWRTWEREEIWKKRLLQEGYSGVYEKEYIRKDGTVFPVVLQSYAFHDEKGKIKYLWGTVRDITARKEAEEALQRRVTQLALLNDVGERIAAMLALDRVLDQAAHLVQETFNYRHVGIFILNREQGEFVMQAKAGDFADLFPPEHRLELGQGMVGWVGRHGEKLLANDVRDEPRYVNLYPESVPTCAELSVPIWSEDEVIGVLDIQSTECGAFDENDVMVMETLADQLGVAVQNAWLYEAAQAEIAERKQTEQALVEQTRALRESERRFRRTIQRSPLGVGIVDSAGHLIECNTALAEMLGYSREELLNLNFEDFTHPDDLKREWALINKLWAGQTTEYRMEKRYLHKDGHEIWVDVAASLSQDKRGELAFGFAFVEDITERRQVQQTLARYAQELKRSNQDLEQFGYVISHDLQAPLRVVQGHLQLLKKGCDAKLNARAQTHVDAAIDGAKRMQAMIRALLNLSRVETRGHPFTRVDCEDLLRNALEDLSLTIKEQDAQLSHDPLPVVMGDGAQLTQVFQNLIANAIKFRRQDVAPRVHVSAEQTGESWTFSITDNGIGVDPEQSDEMFKIFRRLHTEEEYPGLGIGLALCQRIVTRHGGQIWVESEPGRGAAFRFTLPANTEAA